MKLDIHVMMSFVLKLGTLKSWKYRTLEMKDIEKLQKEADDFIMSLMQKLLTLVVEIYNLGNNGY